jgi:hypothetical protein
MNHHTDESNSYNNSQCSHEYKHMWVSKAMRNHVLPVDTQVGTPQTQPKDARERCETHTQIRARFCGKADKFDANLR